MKGESSARAKRRGPSSPAEAEEIAVAVFGCLTGDPERLGRLLSLSGLDPGAIRHAASEPGFLPAILDHVTADEPLLVAIADELDVAPERIAAARQMLSPTPDWEA